MIRGVGKANVAFGVLAISNPPSKLLVEQGTLIPYCWTGDPSAKSICSQQPFFAWDLSQALNENP